MKDPYRIVQVANHAEPEVIEAAYRRLARKYHPDVNPSLSAKVLMQDINWAYEILKDPTKRAQFDRTSRHGAGYKKTRSNHLPGEYSVYWQSFERLIKSCQMASQHFMPEDFSDLERKASLFRNIKTPCRLVRCLL